MRIRLIALVLFMLCCLCGVCAIQPAFAETIEAASCAQEDVQAAINKAVNGDTVLIPEGECTWVASDYNQTPEKTFSNKTPAVLIWKKRLHLKGSGTGKTIIIDDTLDDHGQQAIYIRLTEETPFRISDMTFRMGVSDPENRADVIQVTGPGRDWRVDHCEFLAEGTRSIKSVYVAEESYGLIDHCNLLNSRILVYFGNGHASWKRPLELGSRNAVYIENCTTRKTHFGNIIDANAGGRYVFRNNTVYNEYCEAHSFQNSWKDNKGVLHILRGTRCYEIYNNTFIAEGDTQQLYLAVRVRAGTGVIFGNKVINKSGDSYNGFGAVDNKRTYEEQGDLGVCDGNNPLDGNQPGQNGYPCLDQIGRSTDHGPGEDRHPQELDPVYAWDNTMDDKPVGLESINDPNKYGHIVEDRDFINSDTPKPGYTPYTYPHPLSTSEQEDSGSGGGGGGCFVENSLR